MVNRNPNLKNIYLKLFNIFKNINEVYNIAMKDYSGQK